MNDRPFAAILAITQLLFGQFSGKKQNMLRHESCIPEDRVMRIVQTVPADGIENGCVGKL